MKDYELTLLISPDLEADLDAKVSRVKKVIESAGGSIKKQDNRGKQRLAYAIERQDFAIYLEMDVELPAEAPNKISAALNIEDGVLRYLLVKADPKVVEQRQNKTAEKSE